MIGPMLGNVVSRFTIDIVRDQGGKLIVGAHQLVVEHFDDAPQRQESGLHGPGKSSASSRVRKVSVRPLRMRNPAARVIARASEIARVRACTNSWRTLSCDCTACCRADRRCAGDRSRADRLPSGPPHPAGLFYAPAPVTIHRRVIRIGDDDLMSERLEVLRDPFTLRRGFEQNAHPRSAPERRGQSISRRRNATVKDLARSLSRSESDFPSCVGRWHHTPRLVSSHCASRARLQ